MKPNELCLKLIKPSTAGVLIAASGICFLLLKAYSRGKKSPAVNTNDKKVPVNENRCVCCLKAFFITQGVQCNDCKARSCRKSCAHWSSEDNCWICLLCHHRRTYVKRGQNWCKKFNEETNEIDSESNTNSNTAKYQTYVAGAEHVAINSELDLATGGYEDTNSMENVREIIEKIVENLVGNVDNTPIDRLYLHPAYKPATDSPSMAHTALRELVERAVDEARKLPGLGDTVSSRIQENTSISEQNYEDLLAAAIINKVIEKCQKENIDGNGNVLDDKSCRFIKDKSKMDLDDEVDDDSSSIEPPSLEDSLDGSEMKIHRRTRVQDPLSYTIEEQIEEITTVYTSDEDPGTLKTNLLNFRNAKRVPFPEFGMDIVDPSQESSEESQDEVDEAAHVDHITPVESWEENWLFQKKKIPIKSEPVAMLVPNPSAEYRALIGDKDAEDTSDLSEFSAQSDEEGDDELIQAINQVIPESSNAKEDHQDFLSEQKSKSEPVNINDDFNTATLPIKSSSDETKKDLNGKESLSVTKSVNEKESIQEIDAEGNKQVNDDHKLINNHVKSMKTENQPTRDAEETMKTEILPKTPTPTPVRNSLCDNDQSSTSCDFQKLNKKLGSIDTHINEETSDIEEEFFSAPENQSEKIKNKEIDIEKFIINERHETEENMKPMMPDDRRCKAANAHAAAAEGISKSLNHKNTHDDNLGLSAPPRPGTIAEREHKKWENAPPIQNNPYSQENIQKRLLERQYASRPADVGNPTVLPSSPSPPLQIVLGANRPDIKRFGRDYYINDSKSSNGERQLRSGASNSSRPSSSLSHRSSSTSSDFEQQESFEPIEAATKSLELMQNNKFLERERKNSKNEINAKLNKQGNFDNISTIIGTKNSLTDDNQRKIRPIDLKAYVFENEFNNNRDFKKSHQRIPNKLDLRLFGYDSGLRRAQSNNQLDSKVNNSFVNVKTNIEQIDDKSNLLQRFEKVDDYNWNKSTENLSEEKKNIFDKFNPITSAKSVPNISKIGGYCYDNDKKLLSPPSDEGDNKLKQDNDEIYNKKNSKMSCVNELINEEINNSSNNVNNYESDSQSSKAESEEFSKKFSSSKEFKYSLKTPEEPNKFADKQLPMPSVRKLAQAFNNTPKAASPPRVSKTININKDRPKTPEVHIIRTPRQMHSLTARSLSKEFREGLRQISNKPSAPVSTIIEQSKIPAGTIESNTIYSEKPSDIGVIAPGKLKNDIQFWEQLQKKH
ncbi:uncharacterized protein [Chelonus insularis]|uniref:uncharacterized protein isoform X2 n=1 Tax=Chelonus insularis TaxID=460826 RepID=UPI00158B5AE3|nr:uncharacterized protein LOC118069050 isoform X2 [Chelonus insularis]